MSRIVLVAVCLLVLAGGPVSAAGDDRDEETAILSAVLTQVVDQMVDESLLQAGGVACLSIDPGGAPQSVSREFLEGFGSRPVRRGAECEPRPEGAVELATDRPAVLITAGPIEWVEEDEAWVTVRYFRTALLSAERLYRTVEEKTGWVCLGQILQMAPA